METGNYCYAISLLVYANECWIDDEKTEGNKYMVLQADDENSIDRAHKQRISRTENRNKKVHIYSESERDR